MISIQCSVFSIQSMSVTTQPNSVSILSSTKHHEVNIEGCDSVPIISATAPFDTASVALQPTQDAAWVVTNVI